MINKILEISGVNKYFPGVHALKNMHFELHKGEVHALLGENGAGKSTLIKILAGVHAPDSGNIYFEGEAIEHNDIRFAQQLGISVIYQELALAENMTVAENIFMGREPKKGDGITVDINKMNKCTADLFNKIGYIIKPDIKVSTLKISEKQIVEIAKALSKESKVLVMDEPTASLSKKEVDLLFGLIKNLTSQEVSVIYISHRMEELFEIADRVTVIRDGEYICTKIINETNKNELIQFMVGREIVIYDKNSVNIQDITLLETKELCANKINKINIFLKKGEIVGVAGLIGSGRTEFANALFGMNPISSGEIILNGEIKNIKKPEDAMKNGIVLVPESRKEQGLFLSQTVAFNITICVLERFMNIFRIKKKTRERIEDDSIKKLSIKVSSKHQKAISLSGGNQQKVVLAKWLATNPKVLILDEPTRGIDVGAKAEIYAIMKDLAKQGVGIIMISSELPEVINLSDRVYVMRNGQIKACLDNSRITQQEILRVAAGVCEI